jgi:hypothetical protein
MCGLDPADVLMVEDDPGDALIAVVGRLAWCGAVRYMCGYRWHAGPRLHRQVSPPRSNATVWSMSHRLAGCQQPGERARGTPDAYQVLELEGGTVPDLGSGVIARAGQWDQPEPRQPPREGGLILLIGATCWRAGCWRACMAGWGRVACRRGRSPARAAVGYGTAVVTEEGQAPLGVGVVGECVRQVPGVGGV